jgi:hypothetical protein
MDEAQQRQQMNDDINECDSSKRVEGGHLQKVASKRVNKKQREDGRREKNHPTNQKASRERDKYEIQARPESGVLRGTANKVFGASSVNVRIQTGVCGIIKKDAGIKRTKEFAWASRSRGRKEGEKKRYLWEKSKSPSFVQIVVLPDVSVSRLHSRREGADGW